MAGFRFLTARIEWGLLCAAGFILLFLALTSSLWGFLFISWIGVSGGVVTCITTRPASFICIFLLAARGFILLIGLSVSFCSLS
jgi:hypothetical protein